MTDRRLTLPASVVLLILTSNTGAGDVATNTFAASPGHSEAAPAAAARTPISDTDFVYLFPNDIFWCCGVGPISIVQAVIVDHQTPLTSLTIPVRLTGTHPDLLLDSTVFTPPGVPGIVFGPGGHDSLWDTRVVVVDNLSKTILFQFTSDLPVGPAVSDTLCFVHWIIPDSFYTNVAFWIIDTVAISSEHLQVIGSSDTLIPTWSHATIQVNEVGIQEEGTRPLARSSIEIQPNPFNSQARVEYTLLAPGQAELTVFSILGQRVRHWPAHRRSAGLHEVLWDGRDDRGRMVASGVYYFVLETESNRSTSAGVMLK